MITLFLSLLFAIAITLFAWQRGYFYLEKPSVFRLSFLQVSGAFLIYALVTFFYLPFVGMLATRESLPWLNLSYLLLISLSLFGYLFLLRRGVAAALFWGGAERTVRTWWRSTGMGLVSWLIAYPFVLFTNGMLKILLGEKGKDQVAVEFLRKAKEQPLLLICTLLFVIVIVPITEELLFRGFLQTWLRRFCNRFWGILLSSLIFALVHYAPGQSNIEIISSLLVLACFLGFIYEKERMLWAPIALHSLFNGVSSIIVLFAPIK